MASLKKQKMGHKFGGRLRATIIFPCDLFRNFILDFDYLPIMWFIPSLAYYCLYFSYSVSLWFILLTCCLGIHTIFHVYFRKADLSISYHHQFIEPTTILPGGEGASWYFGSLSSPLAFCGLSLVILRLAQCTCILIHFLGFVWINFVVALYLEFSGFEKDHF